MENGAVWIKLKENHYFGVVFLDNGNIYRYIFRRTETYEESKRDDTYDSKNEPDKLKDGMAYHMLGYFLESWEISRTPTDVLNELQNVFNHPELSINPNDDKNDNEDETMEIETVSIDDDAEPDDNINLDYIPSQLEKYDNDILKMLDDNLTEYVGDKTNLLMLILSVVAVKCGLRSYIININGDSLSGKSTLIKTLFNIIPDNMIHIHNNSTESGIKRDACYRHTTYDKRVIFLGNVTDERKKQLIKIEELIHPLYKYNISKTTMGSKSASENTQNVEITTDTFLSLTQSIKPYRSNNTEINDITSYLTVTKVPDDDLFQQLQLNYKENDPEFMEQHPHYIDNLNPMDMKQDFLNNPELLKHIRQSTNDLNYVELVNYQMLYLSYCIYLNISPSISSFDTFHKLIPESTTLTDKEQDLMGYLKKHHTNKEIILQRKNRKEFKYFSVDMFKKYYTNEYKKHDNFNKTLDSMVRKGALNKNADGLYYLD